MVENKKAPKIRFAGFTDDWEQRKWSDTFITLPNNSLSRAELNTEDGTIKNVHYGDVLIKYGEVLDVTKEEIPYISNQEFQCNNATLLQNGDIIIADAAEDETVGKCSEIAGLTNQKIIAGLHTIPCRPTKLFSRGYLGYYMNSESYHDQLLPLIQGTKISSISKSALNDTNITYPNIEEQEQIGTFFSTIDNLITLHQRKYNNLVVMKKSMLEKMFPKKGSNVPEIRFSGFIEGWEQRKLSEVADKVTEKNANNSYDETFTNSAEFGIISQRDYFDHDISNKDNLYGYYVVKSEDFVYNPRISVSAPVGPINRNKLGRNGVMSPLYTVFRTHDIDTIYLEYFFKSNGWHAFMYFNGDTGARSDRFSIKDAVFMEMPIPYPDIKEQKKIGQYLTMLDSFITLHQRKLEKLKKIKKSMLEKMFV